MVSIWTLSARAQQGVIAQRHTVEAGGIIKMGFGKYTKDERKVVNKIGDLMSLMSYHKRKAAEQRAEIDSLVDKLGGKYNKQA